VRVGACEERESGRAKSERTAVEINTHRSSLDNITSGVFHGLNVEDVASAASDLEWQPQKSAEGPHGSLSSTIGCERDGKTDSWWCEGKFVVVDLRYQLGIGPISATLFVSKLGTLKRRLRPILSRHQLP
jgi:hypothetical protein